MLRPGQFIDRYELVTPIGDGGMAEVWAVRLRGTLGFEKLFALKAVHSRFAEDPAFRAMFLDEARIVSVIEHPNVVQVHDLNETESLLYLVMEYVHGESLFTLIDDHRTVPYPIALRIAADACAGLHAVHSLVDRLGQSRAIVHRDVSPQNILLTMTGIVKLIDFGIAHARDRTAATTAMGTVKGTARYMAPEQVRRDALGPYTDVFGIGATLYRMLAGDAPYAATSTAVTMQALLVNAPPLVALPDAVPKAIRDVLHRAIAPDVKQRFATVKELGHALETLLAAEPQPPNLAAWVTASVGEATRRRHARLVASERSDTAIPRAAELAASNNLPLPPGAPPGTMTTPSATAAAHAMAGIRTVPTAFAPSAVGAPGMMTVPTAFAPSAVGAPGMMTIPTAFAPSAVGAPGMMTIPSAPGHRDPLANAPIGDGAPSGEAPPNFMDVGALVAQAKGKREPEPNGPRQEPAPPGEGSRRAQAKPSAVKTIPSSASSSSSAVASGRALKLALLAIGLVGCALLFILLVPRIVRARAIAGAREAGFQITIDRVGVDFSGISLRGVNAKAIRVPSVTATVQEIFLAGFSGKSARLIGMDARLDGPASELSAGLTLMLADTRTRMAGTPAEARHLSVVSARLTWTGIMGDGSGINAGDIGIELDSRGTGTEDARGSLGRFEGTTRQHATTFGPWAGSFETNAATTRLRVMFDPPVPDGPSALVVWGRLTPIEVTVKIPRSPFATLGVKPTDLGLPADAATELELKMQGVFPAAGRSEVTWTGALWAARVRGHSGPLDIHASGGASGMAGKPLDLEKATVTVGPFTAALTGTITPYETGARLDVLFKTVPVPCERLAKAEAKTMGPLAATLQELAHASGALRVRGNVNASGAVKYDTATPGEAAITWLAKETCGVSIFGM